MHQSAAENQNSQGQGEDAHRACYEKKKESLRLSLPSIGTTILPISKDFFARGSHADLARFRFMAFSFCQWRRPLRSTKRAPKPINSIDEHGGLNEDGT